MLSVAAVSMIVLGVILLRLSWRRRAIQFRFCVLAAWLFIICAVYLWSDSVGWEFAVVYTCIVVAVTVTGAVLHNASYHERRPGKERNKKGGNADKQGIRLSSKFLTFLLAGPVALTFSCYFSITVVRMMAIDTSDQMVIAAFLFPVVWALSIFWTVVTQSRLRTFFSMAVLGTLSFISVFSVKFFG